MRTVRWSNAFARSFKRWMRKRPDLHNDIAEALRLLVLDPFVPQLETHKLKGNTGRPIILLSSIKRAFSIN